MPEGSSTPEVLERTPRKLQTRREIKRRLKEESRTDALTGLHNRRWFEEQLQLKTAEARRQGKNLWVIISDIDFFKKINDELGHATGDKALKTFGEVGSREEEPIARIGGEEFAQVISNGLDLMDIQKIVSRYSSNFKTRTKETIGRECNLSFGIAKLDLEAMESAENLFSRADQALYHSKENGRNQATIYEGKTPAGEPLMTNLQIISANPIHSQG